MEGRKLLRLLVKQNEGSFYPKTGERTWIFFEFFLSIHPNISKAATIQNVFRTAPRLSSVKSLGITCPKLEMTEGLISVQNHWTLR